MPSSTMSLLSYGLERPEDLLPKLILDAEKLTSTPHPFDVFNFVITAAVLNEWIEQFYSEQPAAAALRKARKQKAFDLLPLEFTVWIEDKSCIPNQARDIRQDIMNALMICWHTANASKHYHWTSGSNVTEIESDPRPKDYYAYFFTSTAPDLYIEYDGEHYGLSQIKSILVQFYDGLLKHISCSSNFT